MLPKKYRLTRRKDFAAIHAKGSCAGQDWIVIKYMQSNQLNTRIGFSVSKNFSKKAVQRNRIKRVLREACCGYLDLLKTGFDIIIIPKATKKDKGLIEANNVLKKVFKKVNLLR